MATIETTYREALQKSMFEEMDKNPDVFLMGEDIGRYEGTFKVTKGFFPKYGTRRVVLLSTRSSTTPRRSTTCPTAW